MRLLDDLKWRYATKKFSSKKVSNEDIETIVEAINLSASSLGMQTYRVFVIEDQALKKRLGEGSFNKQIGESSHLLVFAAFGSISQEMIDDYITFFAYEREQPVEELAEFKHAICNFLLPRSDEENFTWSSKQAYIGLGTALIAAANLKIDATPMEGFDADKFDNLLELRDKNLKSVVLLALGYRDQEKDFLANLKKVRVPNEEFAITIK